MTNRKQLIAIGLMLAIGIWGCTKSPTKPDTDPTPATPAALTLTKTTAGEAVELGVASKYEVVLTHDNTPVDDFTVRCQTDIGILYGLNETAAGNLIAITLRTDATGHAGFYLVEAEATGEGHLSCYSSNPHPATASLKVVVDLGGFEIDSIVPNSGTPAGGTPVKIFGTNLSKVDKVYFDDKLADIDVFESVIDAITPPASGTSFPKVVDVKFVLNADQPNELVFVKEDFFKYDSIQPTVYRVENDETLLAEGRPEGGEAATIYGLNFSESSIKVTFGSRSAQVTDVSPGEVHVITPPAPPGSTFPLVVDVTVTNEPGTTYEESDACEGCFTYVTEVPLVFSVIPSFGGPTGGETVEISGDKFVTSPSQPQVTFDNAPAVVISATETLIRARVPAPASGSTFPLTVDVSVTNRAGTPAAAKGTLTDAYTYQGPTILGVSPANVAGCGGGESVTITGTNFCTGSRVRFGTAFGTVISATSTRIVATAPALPGPTSTVDVSVICPTNSALDVTAPQAFSCGCTLQPTITSVSPSSGPIEGGTELTIRGSGFQAPVQVFMRGPGGTSAELDVFSVTNDEIRVVTVPINILGGCEIAEPHDILVRNADCGSQVTFTDAFRYKLTWGISAVTPTEGLYLGGTLVTVHGQGFTAPMTAEICIGGCFPAAIKSVADREVVILTGPSGECGTGSIRLCSVEFAGCPCAEGGSFTYTPPEIATVSPSILIWPDDFVGGASVTITGVGFVAPMEVSFAGYTIVVLASQINADGTSMTVTLPLPAASALNEISCFLAGGCTGLQYTTTAIDLAVTPRIAPSCSVTTTLFLEPAAAIAACRVDPPVASFTSVAGAAGSFQVSFTDTSTVPTGATIASWFWDFGDGFTSTAQNPVHVYPAAGAYTVSLDITDSCGGTASTSASVTAP